MSNAKSTLPAPSPALALSSQLAATVKEATRAVVGVEARRRAASSGIIWSLPTVPGSPAGAPGTGAPAAAGAVVVTADHTVERDEDIAVILPDGHRVPAVLAGRDPATDIAVLRVADGASAALAVLQAPASAGAPDGSPASAGAPDGSPASAGAPDGSPASAGAPDGLSWSDLAELALGHLVLTVARPGYHPRAGLGMVSDLRPGWRTPAGGRIDRYVETEGGLERGFSGSLLLDPRGRALGMNTGGLLRGRAIALPAATLARVVESLLAHGRIRRGFLGIGATPVRLPARLAQELGQATALMVLAVQPESPAEHGGLLLGDVLLAFDGQPVGDVGQLHLRLQEERAGAAAELKVLRAGEVRQLAVTVGER